MHFEIEYWGPKKSGGIEIYAYESKENKFKVNDTDCWYYKIQYNIVNDVCLLYSLVNWKRRHPNNIKKFTVKALSFLVYYLRERGYGSIEYFELAPLGGLENLNLVRYYESIGFNVYDDKNMRCLFSHFIPEPIKFKHNRE